MVKNVDIQIKLETQSHKYEFDLKTNDKIVSLIREAVK